MTTKKFKNYLLTILAFLLFSPSIIAQNGFTPKVEKYVDDYIASLDKSSSELKKIELWYANFKKGQKPTPEVYSQNLIGLGIGASKEKGITYRHLPAKYFFTKNKITLNKITAKKHKQLDIDNYTKAYFKGNKILKADPIYTNLDNDNFAFGATKFKETNNELYAKVFDFIYLRTYQKHLYILAINSNYSIWKNREITFYKFDISLQSNGDSKLIAVQKHKTPKKTNQTTVYKIPNRWKDKNRLYHDLATDEFRETVQLLAQIEPYNKNSAFIENANALPRKLDRDNVKNFIKELTFFQNYKVELTDEMTKKLSYFSKESVKNVNHYASHALADVYMNDKQYTKAIIAFGKALENEYHTAGGTRYIRCLDRIYSDLAEASFAVNKPEIGVLYLLAVVANQDRSSAYANEQLIAYGNTINTKKFKENLIFAIDSIKENGALEYTIVYKNNKATFKIPFFSTAKGVQIRLVKSSAFNSFNHK